MIVVMDCGVLAVEFTNLYTIETTLKGVRMRQSKKDSCRIPNRGERRNQNLLI